ncbi:hypothetical protein GGG16DRAFT_117470 [Schizophyllum commune]
MSQRSRLPPQQPDACEQPSTVAKRPSKPDLMCPTCGTFLVTVGNLNRHRRDLHRWVNPDNKKTRQVQPTQPVIGEGNDSKTLSILIYTHPTVKPLRTLKRTFLPATSTMPLRTQPPLTNSTLLSATSNPFTTPLPPYVAHTLGRTLGGDMWSREDHSFATGFSSPVDDGYHSSDAMDLAVITDRDDVSISRRGTTHSFVAPCRLAQFDASKGSHCTSYSSQRARAPRHFNHSIAGIDYHLQLSTDVPPVPTMHFPPVPPPQPGLYWSDTMEVGHGQEQQAEASRRQQALALQLQVASAQHAMARGPHHERNTCMVQARQQQEESHSRIWPMRESHAPSQQYAGASAPTHVPTRMYFDQRAPQASTSHPQQAYHTPLFSPRSGDHLVCFSEQAPYERSAHSAFNSQLFPAFDSHRHPDSGEHLQARDASFDEIAHNLNDPAIHAPNFFGNFKLCCPESDTSAF